MLSLATSRSPRQPRVGSGEGLALVAFNDRFSSGLYRRLSTHLPEEVARNPGCPDYSVSYPFLVSRYLMIPGFDLETRDLRLDKTSAYLLFTGINSAEFIGRWGLRPDDRVVGKESHHALYVMSVPCSVVVLYHGHGVCDRVLPPSSHFPLAC